ncbi:acetate--CoA ligase family protein [Streptomyces tendae]
MTDLSAFFSPRGIVVVGASASPGKLGAAMAASLRGYPGHLALVNSRGGEGMHTSIGAAVAAGPVPTDLAVLCVPAAAVPDTLRQAAAHGIRAALVCAGGFAEAGGPGLELDRRVRAAVADTGIRLVGPNTSGYFLPGQDLTASFAPGAATLPRGPVAVVAASGGVNHALSFRLAAAGAGLRLGIGLGSGLDVTHADVLDHLAGDSATRVVALHLESVGDGPALLASVRALSRVKPVVALVVGRNDVSAFAQSHTGALATSWRTTRSLLRQAGAVVVDDEIQLVNAVIALTGVRLPPQPDPGVALVTAQAGPGLLAADALHSARVALPVLEASTQCAVAEILPPLTYQANPVDTGRPGPGFDRVISAVAADPGVSAVAVYGLTEPVVDLPGSVGAADLPPGLPVVIGVDGPEPDVADVRARAALVPVPVVQGPSALAAALAALAQDARNQYLLRSAAEPTGAAAAPAASRDETWDEARTKDLLGSLGIATPARRRCPDRAEAHRALAELGGPVAVKLLDADVLHKTEIGGVHLGVSTPDALDRALDALEEIGAREFLVEAMAPPGVDLIVGARRDPVFGPVTVLGLGGTTAEALADVSVRAAPLTPAEAESMADDLAGRELLSGWRSGPVADRAELGRVLRVLGDVLASHNWIDEIEINPLRLTHGGLRALDAVLVTAGKETDGAGPEGDTDAHQ